MVILNYSNGRGRGPGPSTQNRGGPSHSTRARAASLAAGRRGGRGSAGRGTGAGGRSMTWTNPSSGAGAAVAASTGASLASATLMEGKPTVPRRLSPVRTSRGHRVWVNEAAKSAAPTGGSTSSAAASGGGIEGSTSSSTQNSSASVGAATLRKAVTSGPTTAIESTSKAGNRVWRNVASSTTKANVTTETSSERSRKRKVVPAELGSRVSTLSLTHTAYSFSAPVQASVTTSKSGNRVWTSASVSLSKDSSPESREDGSVTSSASKGGNRVWTNPSQNHSNGSSAGKKTPAGSYQNTMSVGNRPASKTMPLPSTTPATTRPVSVLFVQPNLGTSKAGNRVWTNTSCAKGHDRSGPVAAIAVAKEPVSQVATGKETFPSAAAPDPSAQRPLRAVPSFASTGTKSSKAGHLVWTNPAAGDRGVAQKVVSAKSQSLQASSVSRVAEVQPSKARKVGDMNAQGVLSGAQSARFTTLGSTPRADTSTTAGSVDAPILKYSRSLASNRGPRAAEATARYPGSNNEQMIVNASTNDRSGGVGSARSDGISKSVGKAQTVGQIARYSGTRGGRGYESSSKHNVQQRPAAGTSSAFWSRGGKAARGGASSIGAGRGHSVWGRGKAQARGRGSAAFLRYQPSHRLLGRSTYSYGFPPPFMRYRHSTAGWAARWEPWAAAHAGRKARMVSDSRGIGHSSRPLKNKPRFQNRTLIRVRSLVVPPSTSSSAAAARRASIAAFAARRASLSRLRLASAAATKAMSADTTPTKFVRSGKHGMAIRRVNSVDLAARRAATTRATHSAVRAIGTKRKTGERNDCSLDVPRAIGGSEVKEAAAAPTGAKRINGPRAAVLTRTSSPTRTVTPRKLELLKKLWERSSVTVGSRRRAAAALVVADARAKRARVIGRNMTLYRDKAGVSAIGGDVSSQATAATRGAGVKETSKKSKRVKTEPCLFFCKFGKCSKSEEECRFVHDKSKVAVCRAFLKGTCTKGEDCLLTHAIQAEKMPVCIYFEKGMCFTPNCPYLHVKVSDNAAICPNFLKGYCPDGTACRLKHELGPRKRRMEEASDGGDQGEQETNSADKNLSMSASQTGALQILPVLTARSAAGGSGLSSASTQRQQGKEGKYGARQDKRSPSEESDTEADSLRSVCASGATGKAISAAAAARNTSPQRRAVQDTKVDDDDEGLKPKFPWKRRRL